VTPPLVFDGVALHPDGAGGLDLVVPHHQAVSVVGEAESGIDRLGAFALALDRPTRGVVRVYGEDVGSLPRRHALAFRRRVGYLPPGDGLLQNLSLRDNVALPLRFGSDLRDRDIEGRLQVMLAAVRLGRVADLRPSQVTDEQRRRAALARALAFDPELVILEQPFDGLSNRVAAELLELARGGETAEGSRRAVLITGQEVPDLLLSRIEQRYRVVHDQLRPET